MTQTSPKKTVRYDPRYLEGIRWFNNRNFFQAHETWEEIWMDRQDESKRFYQGLIQAAVCLHHFERGNIRGARKLYHSSRRYLKAYCPSYQGLDLDRLLDDMTVCCQEIIDQADQFPKGKLDPQQVPKIYLEA